MFESYEVDRHVQGYLEYPLHALQVQRDYVLIQTTRLRRVPKQAICSLAKRCQQPPDPVTKTNQLQRYPSPEMIDITRKRDGYEKEEGEGGDVVD